MVAVWTERRSKSARVARTLSLFALVLAIVAAVAHRIGQLPTETFLFALGVVAVLALLAACFGLYGFARMWRHGDRVGSNLVVTALVILLLSAPAAWMGFRGFTTPRLNDVATDQAIPPALLAGKSTSPWQNPIGLIDAEKAAKQREAYPELTPHRYVLDAARLRQLVADLVETRGWEVTRPFAQGPVGAAATLNAVARSFLLGFPSDVAIRVADDGDSSLVDMRSASRFGDHDFGDNAQRIRRFFEELDAAVTAGLGTSVPAIQPDDAPEPETVLPSPRPRPEG